MITITRIAHLAGTAATRMLDQVSRRSGIRFSALS